MAPAQEFTINKPTATKQVVDLQEERSSVFTTLISLVIGAIVLISIPALIVFLVIHFRGNSNKKPVATSSVQKSEVHMTANGTPIVTLPAQPSAVSDQIAPNTATKPYIDISGFSVKIPANWRAFTRAGDANAYQVAFGPANSPDIPVTINVVKNTQFTIPDWIATQFGANYPQSLQHIGNADATIVQSNGLTSYFFSKNTTLYQITVVTNNPNYQAVLSQILSSFTL